MRNALANLAAVMIRPRDVVRRVLDSERGRMILPLALLAAFSMMAGDFNVGELDSLRNRGVPFALVLAGIIVAGFLVFLALFYLFSWAAYGIGKLLEGTGSARDVRAGMAWGLVPLIWALLYRLPVAIFFQRPDETSVEVAKGISFSGTRLGSGCMMVALLGILELITFVWCVYVASNTVGEAHRFSSLRGLGTLLLVGISPAVIVLAAALAM